MTTVLIVDDDASIRFAMADFLGAHGIGVAFVEADASVAAGDL